MITSIQDYNEKLHLIYNNNFPRFAQLDTNEFIYDIDIKSRTILAPEFLGVEQDHRSETIYFRVDRYVDYMDLATTACIIIYQNAKGEQGIAIPQFYDIYTESLDEKILIPWKLTDHVNAASGKVTFTIRFFKTAMKVIQGKNPATPIVIYDLNFLPATSQVLKSLTIKEEIYNQSNESNNAASILEAILSESQSLIDKKFTYWTII